MITHPFPEATVEDPKDYMTPLARKEPDVLIIHVGTNNIHTDRPKELVEKLIKLHKLSISPSTKNVLSNIIDRHDFKKGRVSKRISKVNTVLLIECKQKNIYLLANRNREKRTSS